MSDEFLFDSEAEEEATGGIIYAFAAAPGLTPGEEGRVFAASDEGVKRSIDGGRTWQDALAGLNLSEPLPVTSLAIATERKAPVRILAGASGGVFYSANGLTWKAVVMASPAPTVSALVVSPNYEQDSTVFAGTIEDGVFVSQNGGERWVAWNFGLLDLNVMCLAVSPDFAQDETIFAGTETGIFRSTNGGRAWHEIEPPFGYDAVISLALSLHYAQDHTLYAGTEEHGLWVSADEGESWSRLAETTLVEPVNAILLSEKDGLLAVAGGLWHSADGGKSWTNRLPEAYAGQEISAALAPQGFGSGKKALVGLEGGTIEVIGLM